MTAKTTDLARSINDRLSTLAIKREAPFENILTEFLLERMAARIVADPSLAGAIIFGYIRISQSEMSNLPTVG